MYIKNESTMKLFKVFHKNFNVDDDDTRTTTAYTDTFKKMFVECIQGGIESVSFSSFNANNTFSRCHLDIIARVHCSMLCKQHSNIIIVFFALYSSL